MEGEKNILNPQKKSFNKVVLKHTIILLACYYYLDKILGHLLQTCQWLTKDYMQYMWILLTIHFTLRRWSQHFLLKVQSQIYANPWIGWIPLMVIMVLLWRTMLCKRITRSFCTIDIQNKQNATEFFVRFKPQDKTNLHPSAQLINIFKMELSFLPFFNTPQGLKSFIRLAQPSLFLHSHIILFMYVTTVLFLYWAISARKNGQSKSHCFGDQTIICIRRRNGNLKKTY